MNLETLKSKLEYTSLLYPSSTEGQKYIKNWNHYIKEKIDVLNLIPFENVSTVLDIGTGIGIIPFLLQEKGLIVEGTDIEDNLFKACCEVIGFPRFYLKILPQEKIKLTKSYDLILSTRTVFDRRFTDEEDWRFFLDDIFNYCDKLFLKTNEQNPLFPKFLSNFMFYPNITGKSWCLYIEKHQWM